MNCARAWFGLVSANDLLYAVGGEGQEAGKSAEVFDPAMGVWTMLAEMPATRNHFALVHVQDETP